MTERDELGGARAAVHRRTVRLAVAPPRVYLAGPPFAEEYRRRAAALLRASGLEPVDPMRRDFRGHTAGHEREIVEGDLEDIRACDVRRAVVALAPGAELGAAPLGTFRLQRA